MQLDSSTCVCRALNWRRGETGLLVRHPETAECRRSDLRPAECARHKRACHCGNFLCLMRLCGTGQLVGSRNRHTDRVTVTDTDTDTATATGIFSGPSAAPDY
jgi:hypothetical protein